MRNALQMTPPPAPNPQPNMAQSSVASGPTPGQPNAPAPAPPPPSHQQVVAGLRHFAAIKRELIVMLKNPDVGRADTKSALIDQTTKLVSDGVLTPAQAVTQLASYPTRPFDQKAWLEKHLVDTFNASDVLLDHHRMAYAGQAVDSTSPDPDRHSDTVSALMSQYKGASNA